MWVLALPQAAAPDCKDWKACRELALEAAGRQDYDAFHDLAWKALNAGPKNEPALMAMLARAQSLSGRPGDALVMLNRLAAMGVATDASTSDDFERVRALPGWAELEAKLAGVTGPPVTSPPAATRSAAAGASVKEPPPAKESAKPAGKPTASPPAPKPGSSPLSFSSAGITAGALAYDAVSGRFIVADVRDRRLLVLGERSGRLASLAGIDAGLGDISAMEIDSREGDLWVVSNSPAGSRSTLHKLQLISGRVLFSIPLPAEQGDSRFTDVAITPLHVLVLDAEGRRVLRATKKGKTLDVAARLAAPDVASLAPSSETTAYAAYDRGLVRIDLATGTLSVVEPGKSNVDLSGITWMRWHRGGLVATQKRADGSHRLVRVRLDDGGRSARAVEAIDDAAVLAGPGSAAIADNVLYYLGKSPSGDELIVKKIPLK